LDHTVPADGYIKVLRNIGCDLPVATKIFESNINISGLNGLGRDSNAQNKTLRVYNISVGKSKRKRPRKNRYAQRKDNIKSTQNLSVTVHLPQYRVKFSDTFVSEQGPV
jgi:hypothetical protein